MAESFCLVMGQMNPVVGDVAGNVNKIIHAAKQAKAEFNADLVVFPELALTGYPPEDLLLRPELLARVNKGLKKIQKKLASVTAVLVGHIDGVVREELYNAASVIAQGQILGTYYKQTLPNYGVFDEKRYFIEGSQACIVELKGLRLGITICEDIWFTAPASQTADAGADMIVNLNASPFHAQKPAMREAAVRQRIQETGLPVIYVNQVGGQDELIFDGSSFAISAQGEKVVQAPAWESGLFPVHISFQPGRIQLAGICVDTLDEHAMIYQGLVCGLRDYVEKNHFSRVVLGLSGGIDSALTLALAVDALGADRVDTVMMPTRYTAKISLEDAKAMADTLGVRHEVMAIDNLFSAFLDNLAPLFAGAPADTTEENIQARIRGVILMALSNKTGAMVLSTGNKSEMAVGYSTLYGDMAGGYAPLKDVYKTRVYALARFRNTLSPIIPERILTRPPSAELAPNQLDQDALPPYDVLDAILEKYIAQDWSFEQLIEAGYDAGTVSRVITLVDRNEYKRRQAPPGIRITQRAFGRDRRYPITSGFEMTANID